VLREQAERENGGLPEEPEDLGIMLLAQERLAEPTPVDRLIGLEELARRFGREDLLAAKEAVDLRSPPDNAGRPS